MEKIGLKKLLLQIKNIDLKRAFCRFCKSDNPLKYVLFPFGGYLFLYGGIVWLSSISQGLFQEVVLFFCIPLLLIGYLYMYISNEIMRPINLFLEGIWSDRNPCFSYMDMAFCLNDVLKFYVEASILLFIIYIIWDVKKGNLNIKIDIASKVKKSIPLNNILIIKLITYCLYIFNFIKEVLRMSLKKALLGCLIPALGIFLIGDGRYNHYANPFSKRSCPHGINPGGYGLEQVIKGEIEKIYYDHAVSGKLEEKFGNLRKYITAKEWQSFRCSLPVGGEVDECKDNFNPNLFIPNANMMHFNHDLRGVLYKKDGGMFYNKERHICRYNENGIGEEELYYYFLCRSGRFYFSKYESELTNLLKLSDNSRCYAVNEYIQYKCPKYQYYITALECIKKTMFAKLPKNINTYLNDKIYLGIYDELLYAFNGKMFKIIEQIAKHPCYYTDNNLSSYGLYGLQCKKPLKNRQFQYINLYIYNKDGKITGNIKIRRADK